jgi:hypothetical protein
MNKRIQELAEQAEKYADDNFKGENFWTQAYESKFAELIVRECADICLEMAAKCAGLPGDGALAKDCAYWIKKNFGVEE